MSNKIDYERVKAALKATAAQHPLRTNNGVCQYVKGGKPNCIVAHVVTSLGLNITEKVLQLDDGEYGVGDEGSWGAHNLRAVRSVLPDLFPDRFEPRAIELLHTVQAKADNADDRWPGQKPWIDAVTEVLVPIR